MTRRTQAERRAETRKKLLDAAVMVFAKRGYHAAGVAEIASAADCSTGAIYGHFGSKESLFLAVLEEQIPAWMAGYASKPERTKAKSAGKQTAEARTERRVKAVAGQWDLLTRELPEGWLLLIELWSVCVRDPQMKPRFAECYDLIRQATIKMLQILCADGDVHLPLGAEDTGSAMVALVDGYALQRIADPDAVDKQGLVAALRQLVGLGPVE